MMLSYFLWCGHFAETVFSYKADISLSEEFSLLEYNAV